MALTLDPATRVISVPQADLTFVSGTLYSLDTDAFRKNVFNLLASEDYMWMPDAFSHNTEVTVAGTTFARIIEFINGYSITFEDTGATYSVRLEGSNNNLFDVDNGILNPTDKLTVIPTNSAGLIGSKQVDDQSFTDSRVWIDVSAGQAGTQFPVGTPGTPVNNLADAQAIITARTLPKRLQLRGTLVIGASENIDNYDILGQGDLLSAITFTAGSSCEGMYLEGASVSGVMSGESILRRCDIGTLSGFEGGAVECYLSDVLTLASPPSGSVLNDCRSNVAGALTPTINCNSAAGVALSVRGYFGGLKLTNFNQAGNNASIDSPAMRLTLESSCTDGTIVVGGIGALTDNSAGSAVLSDSFNPGGTDTQSLMSY